MQELSLVMDMNRQIDQQNTIQSQETDSNMQYLIKVKLQPVGEKLSNK